jgi:hypothetical protein
MVMIERTIHTLWRPIAAKRRIKLSLVCVPARRGISLGRVQISMSLGTRKLDGHSVQLVDEGEEKVLGLLIPHLVRWPIRPEVRLL